MWVLSTARAELHYFADCAAVTGGYAILSHTWTQDSAGEQTFQEVRSVIKKCKKNGRNPRDHVGEKIRRCCEIAERDGYAWIWIDSCCINKESSTELSEAINSMFNWYALAEVCYVYLEDVPHADDARVWLSSFWRARWHSRGWTLQELLAPAFVVFFSKEWKRLGTKNDLRVPLSQCTGINVEYLTREWDFRVDASIARRMSWAAKRETTRVEDEAYCLLGLFDINMPTLYGEGRHAFQRLQAELVKKSTDATLFAWSGCYFSTDDEREQGLLSQIQRNHDTGMPDIFLFAPSPSRFAGWSNVYSSPWAPSPTGLPSPISLEPYQKDNVLGQVHDEIPSFEVNPHGMKCRFPVAEVDGVIIAVLPCEWNHERLGLLLHPAPNNQTHGPSGELFYVSWSFPLPTEPGNDLLRLACLGGDIHNLRFRGKHVAVKWSDIYIAAHPPTTGRRDGAHLLQGFLPDVAPVRFWIPRTLMQTLGMLEFFPNTGKAMWDLAPNATIVLGFESTTLVESIHILLGTCTQSSKEARPRHWAWAEERYRATWGQPWREYVHNCATDHIEDWLGGMRVFGDADRRIRLVFAPCKHAPHKPTLVLGLELFGSVYEMIQKNANVHLPPPIRFSQERVDEVASTCLNGCLRVSTTLSAPSLLRRFTSAFIHSAARYRIGRPKAARHPMKKGFASHSETRACNATTCEISGIDGLVNTPSNFRDVIQELIESNNADRDREIQEVREAHEAQTWMLNEALAELAQMKTLFAQISQDSTAPPLTTLAPP